MNKTRNAILFLFALMIVGTVGYSWIEHWRILDSAYMTVITLSTVGFREFQPLSDAGKVFTSVLIVLGVGTLAYAATKTTESLLEHGLALRDAPLRREMNVLLIAVRKGGEKLVFNPSRDLVLMTGDKLLALGEREVLLKLETYADGS